MSLRIGVIGGGISGLSSAAALVQSGIPCQVIVWEAGERIGGLLQTDEEDGCLIERSADMFTTKLPYAVDLCRLIGYEQDLIPTNQKQRGARLVTPGGLEPIPTGFSLMVPKQLGPLLRSNILSPMGKLRVLLEPVSATFRRRFRTGNEPDESLHDFAVRHWGNELFQRIIQPLVAGIYTADPRRLSMKAALPEFVEMEQKYGRLLAVGKENRKASEADGDFQDSLSAAGKNESEARTATGARYGLFLTPRQGMQHWVRAIGTWLESHNVEIRTNQTVGQIKNEEHLWKVQTGDGNETIVDALIVATPVQQAAKLLSNCVGSSAGSLTSDLASQLEQLESASAAIVVATIPRSQLPDHGEKLGFGLVVPDYLNRPMIACSFSSNKFPGRVPADQLLVRCFFGGALHPEYLQLPDSELIELAQSELRSLLNTSEITLERGQVVRWNQAMPQYHVEHLNRVEAIESKVAGIPGLAIAGNAYRGVGIPQCIRSGFQAAEKVLADCKANSEN